MTGANPGDVCFLPGQFQHFCHQVGHAFAIAVLGFKNILCCSRNKTCQPIFKSDIADIILHPVKNGFHFFYISGLAFYKFSYFGFQLIWLIHTFFIQVVVPIV